MPSALSANPNSPGPSEREGPWLVSQNATAGRRMSLSTTRDGGEIWDETYWEYDPASGVNTAKEYADGSRVTHAYTDNGRRTRTTWARGAWREHAYNERNLVSGTTYSGADTPSVVYAYDDSGALTSASLSDGTAYAYARDDRLLVTNETVAVAQDECAILRTYDAFRHPQNTAVVVTNVRHSAATRIYDAENRIGGYALTNAAGRALSVTFAYDGSYLTNALYSLPGGGAFAVSLTREPARRELVTRRDYAFNGQPSYWYATDYDLLGRPTNATDSVSLAREWLYNSRSELVAATVGTNAYGYAYDTIGNRSWSSADAATNTYAANALNQYTSLLCDSAPLRYFQYDADGNLTRDGAFRYAYDAENRLVSAMPAALTNGAVRVLNAYDHRHRRIRKTVQSVTVSIPPAPSPPSETYEWSTVATHTYVWDGDNIVLERIAFSDGTSCVYEYFWGPDMSGTEQGAGGVGGLLAESIDGVFYLPCYDHNGNIVRYVSESGAVAAEYVYDPYGGIAEESGPLSSAFTFGFSTKPLDRETGLVPYQRRFYRPAIGRWINRDPIEEEGGENLYAFCRNSPSIGVDSLGLWLSDEEAMLGISIGIPVAGDMFEMDLQSQNHPPFFQTPPGNRANRRIDEFLDGPDFAALEKQLTAELTALCPNKPTRGTGLYSIKCCEPEKCRTEAMAIANAYIAALEEAYRRRPWYLPGGWTGNFVINLLHDNSTKPGQNYPEDLDVFGQSWGWVLISR